MTAILRTRLEWWSFALATTTVALVVLSALCAVASYLVDRRLRRQEAARIVSIQEVGKNTKDSLDAASAQLTVLQSEVRQKDAEISSLQRRVGRRLSPEERQALVQGLALASGHPIVIASHMGDAESIRYAEELLQAFNSAGWHAEANLMSLNAFPGVSILARLSSGEELPGVDTIQRAFQKAGLELVDPGSADVKWERIGAVRGGTIILVVGRNPN
jgi:hypothetical protein